MKLIDSLMKYVVIHCLFHHIVLLRCTGFQLRHPTICGKSTSVAKFINPTNMKCKWALHVMSICLSVCLFVCLLHHTLHGKWGLIVSTHPTYVIAE